MSHPRADTDEDLQSPSGKRQRVVESKPMHKDSKYRHYTPNFVELARLYPDTFGGFVMYLDDEKTEGVIDWENPAAARALTQTLLAHDFGLQWDIPIERLCPPVPNRLNYICWIKDLLMLDHPGLVDEGIRGLDIGTGASAIYPLLGAKVYGWAFIATDIDGMALEAAQANIVRNGLENRIMLKGVTRYDYSTVTLKEDANYAPGPIMSALQNDNSNLDFCMCNPPFFESLEEVGEQAPHGCIDEMITPGGELAFVTAMIKDSVQLKDRVRWYTSMVGKKITLKRVLGLLRQAHIINVRTTEFLQGRTTRWGVAWSFGKDGLAELQGGGAGVHKVFGRKKLEKRREANETFVVKPTAEGETLDEETVIQRVIDFFNETQQVQVAGVGVGKGGAEELYRRVVVAELNSSLGGAGGAKSKKIPETVSPMDPDWKKRCVVLVTVLAGAAHEDGHHEPGAEDGNWVNVRVEMTSGGDRAAFFRLTGVMPGEVARTNRRWRRKLGGGGGGGGGGASKQPEPMKE